MRREPLIYDLWADIRVYWKLADLYDRQWQKLKKAKDDFMKISWDSKLSERVITLVPYEFWRKN